MGKKSRRNDKDSAASAATSQAVAAVAATASQGANTPTSAPIYYPSDGPSDVELLQTTSSSLQAKLDRLTQLGLANDRAGFVEHFVPLDLSADDARAYLEDLTNHPEADGQWNNLVSEIAAIRCGKGVDRIEGDQQNKAVFYFVHPLLQNCDREVAFCCVNGEWRAEG